MMGKEIYLQIWGIGVECWRCAIRYIFTVHVCILIIVPYHCGKSQGVDWPLAHIGQDRIQYIFQLCPFAFTIALKWCFKRP